ncbi:MAG: hypothetical protein KDA54_12800 [Phycisphaerales bacterium]|nr:hypothetical protein [Phycisphaerales bacterium]
MSKFPAHRLEKIARLANVEVAGPFARGDVKLSWSDAPRPSTDVLERLIAEVWARERALADDSGAVLFNGDLVRHIDHALIDDGLHIDVGPTDYKSFLGTNLRNGVLLDEIGRDAFANAIGVSALITCNREPATVLLGHRSAKVVDQPGTIHTFGGALDADDRGDDGQINVFAAVTREICEELALRPDDLAELECLGLVCDRSIWQPELVFAARVDMNADELANRVDVSSMTAEHLDVERIVDSPAEVAAYIVQAKRTTPVAMSALCLYGWGAFGDGWFSDVLGRLG